MAICIKCKLVCSFTSLHTYIVRHFALIVGFNPISIFTVRPECTFTVRTKPCPPCGCQYPQEIADKMADIGARMGAVVSDTPCENTLRESRETLETIQNDV